MSANKDEALKCLELSQRYFSQGDRARALKFAQKSLSLHSTPAAESWLERLQSTPTPPAPSDSPHPARPSNSASASSTASSSTETVNQREYTPAQEAAVRKVMACGQDYYAVLGCARDATDADLKRAYRKLALQFHPDKNGAPGASDAFKLISSAFGALSDPDKRKMYDMYGTKAFQPGGRAASDESGGNPFAGHGAEMTPEQLFEMFFGHLSGQSGFAFGMDGQQARFRTHRHHQHQQQQQRRRRQHEQNEGMSLAGLLQLLPLLIFLFLSWFPWSWNRDPGFALHRVRPYTEQYHTTFHNVEYFLSPGDYDRHFANDRRRLRNFETKVESDYMHLLQSRCATEMQQKQRRVSHARWWGSPNDLDEANAIPLPSCTALNELRRK